jgi:hypothetical protein
MYKVVIDKFDLGTAWMNIVRDYERRYSHLIMVGAKRHKDIDKHRKMLYGFQMLSCGNLVEFESEKDYLCFLLKWS